MPEDAPSHGHGHGHGHEGWHAYEHAGYALTAALYGLAFLGCAVAALLFAIYFPGHSPRPWPRPFPVPRLNARIDRDPQFSFAPRPVPAAIVEPAMRALAAQGDAGWGPQGGAGPAPERVPAARSGFAGSRLSAVRPVRRQGRARARPPGYRP